MCHASIISHQSSFKIDHLSLITHHAKQILLDTYTSLSKVYTILLSRDLKTKKVRHQHPHPHPHPHPHQNKKIISVPTTKILIKYKRIKWTPSRKASHLLSGGKKPMNSLRGTFGFSGLYLCYPPKGVRESRSQWGPL